MKNVHWLCPTALALLTLNAPAQSEGVEISSAFILQVGETFYGGLGDGRWWYEYEIILSITALPSFNEPDSFTQLEYRNWLFLEDWHGDRVDEFEGADIGLWNNQTWDHQSSYESVFFRGNVLEIENVGEQDAYIQLYLKQIPTPASLALLGIGGLVAASRKR